MITAVDSSVLLDVLSADATFGRLSGDALKRSMHEGSIIACEVVWAETTGWFAETEGSAALRHLGVGFDAIGESASSAAGQAWRAYREAGGPRGRLIADFLVGAHAQGQADRLLTRDRGFHRRYFSQLAVLDPTQPLP